MCFISIIVDTLCLVFKQSDLNGRLVHKGIKMEKSKKNKDKKLYIALIIVIALFFVFLLFPRAYYQRDGGSAIYDSFGGGIIYKIDYRHRLYDEGDNVYFQVGCIIYIFGHEVFNNVHVDYSHLAVEKNDAKVSEINEQLESIFSTSK